MVDWYTELKGWQSGLGALVGFLALVLGALFNFHLNRRRDRDLRDGEMRSVAAAIYGEILLMRSEIALVAKLIARLESVGREITPQFARDYTPKDPMIYPALASKMGLLSPELLIGMTSFYANYEEAKRYLPLIAEEREVRYHPAAVLRPAVDAVDEVVPVLRCVEELLGIAQAKDPDYGLASQIVEELETRPPLVAQDQ